jgi:hypothetical protein
VLYIKPQLFNLLWFEEWLQNVRPFPLAFLSHRKVFYSHKCC